MLRSILATSVVLFLSAGVASAEEVKGVFKSYDAEAKKLTITVGDEEKTYTVAEDAKLARMVKGEKKEISFSQRKKGPFGPQAAGKAKLTLTIKDDKVVAVAVGMAAGKPKKADK